MIYEYARLTHTDLKKLVGPHSVAIVTISPLEVHGPHLPLGSDPQMAHWVAKGIVERLDAQHPDWAFVNLPPFCLGMDTLPLVGSIEIKQRTLRDVVVEIGSALAKMGFKYILVANGHGGPRHTVALEEAAEIVSRKYGVEMFAPSGALIAEILGAKGIVAQVYARQLGRALTQEELDELEYDMHAGHWETAIGLVLHPELVQPYARLGFQSPPSAPWLDRLLASLNSRRAVWPLSVLDNSIWAALDSMSKLIGFMFAKERPAYMGTPRLATREYGEAVLQAIVQRSTELTEKAIFSPNSLAKDETHSPFWSLWPLRTDFWRWVIGIVGGLAALGIIASIKPWNRRNVPS